MKKLIAVLAALAVLAAPTAAGAGKKPKPYKSETVHIMASHPIFNGYSGSIVSLTAQEFMARCALPSSQGVDGWVFEIPAEYQSITSYISATGSTSSPTGAYDIDIYTFDADCNITLAINAAGTDQTGVLPVGTAFIFVHSYEPGDLEVQFTLKPYKV